MSRPSPLGSGAPLPGGSLADHRDRYRPGKRLGGGGAGRPPRRPDRCRASGRTGRPQPGDRDGRGRWRAHDHHRAVEPRRGRCPALHRGDRILRACAGACISKAIRCRSHLGLIAAARARGFATSMQATGWLGDVARLATWHEQLFAAFDIIVLHRESLAAIPGCPAGRGGRACDHLAQVARRRAEAWPEIIAGHAGRGRGGDGDAVTGRRRSCVPALSVPGRRHHRRGRCFRRRLPRGLAQRAAGA